MNPEMPLTASENEGLSLMWLEVNKVRLSGRTRHSFSKTGNYYDLLIKRPSAAVVETITEEGKKRLFKGLHEQVSLRRESV